EHVGMPECQFALAQAAIYLSLAPKSDRAKRSIGEARAWIREHSAELPPLYLRSGGFELARRATGKGLGYDNPHGHPGHLSGQELMPPSAVGRRFYEPDETEAELAARLERIRRERGQQ